MTLPEEYTIKVQVALLTVARPGGWEQPPSNLIKVTLAAEDGD